MKLGEGIAVAGAALAVAGGGVGAAVVAGGVGKKESFAPVPAANAKVNPAANLQNETADLCNETPYTALEYNPAIGPDLVADIGQLAAGNKLVFDGNADKEAPVAAKALARNNAALSVVYTIVNSTETGITPSRVLDQSINTWSQMEQNVKVRQEVCAAVIGRVLATPKEYTYQSPTGKIATYIPVYNSDKSIKTVDAPVTPNSSDLDLFSVAPVSGSTSEARDKAISENWGITPEGAVVQTAQKQGEVHPSHHGREVKVSHHRIRIPASVLLKHVSPNAAAAPNKLTSTGKSGAVSAGPIKEKNLGPLRKGRKEAAPNGKHPTPSTGTPSTSTPITSRPPRPTTTETTTQPTQTQTTETTTQPTQTQTTETTPTTTTPPPSPKDQPKGGCDPNSSPDGCKGGN